MPKMYSLEELNVSVGKHLYKVEQTERKCFEPQPYVRTMTECLKYKSIGVQGVQTRLKVSAKYS